MEGNDNGNDVRYDEIVERSLSAIQYLRAHGFSTYMESEGIINRIMMFKDKNEMGTRELGGGSGRDRSCR